MMNQITYAPIGTIHSPFTKPEGMPIQPSAGQGIKGHILIHEEFVEGLADLGGFSHIYLLFHLHLSDSYRLKVTPFLDDKLRGVFSTRAPRRPNPIGLSVVKLIRIEGNRLDIENVDMIDGNPAAGYQTLCTGNGRSRTDQNRLAIQACEGNQRQEIGPKIYLEIQSCPLTKPTKTNHAKTHRNAHENRSCREQAQKN
jgi:tRNA-Thr(GGU) m(6)t(6)A37 methyltransferase TsaA